MRIALKFTPPRPSFTGRIQRRFSSEEGRPFSFRAEDAVRLLRSEGLSIPQGVASQIAQLVQTHGQAHDLHFSLPPFDIHCRHSGLPSFASLTKVILLFGLQTLRQKNPEQTLDLAHAAKNFFVFKDPRTAVQSLRTILHKTGVGISADGRTLTFDYDDREQSFTIVGKCPIPFDGFALANQFLVTLYNHFGRDIKKVSEFFGREPLHKIRYHLAKAGAEIQARSDVANFVIPPTLRAVFNPETNRDILSRLIPLMGDIDAMANHQGTLDRDWLDWALERFTADVITEVFSLEAMQKISSDVKGLLISEAWHHLQNLMRKRVQMKEFMPGLDFDYRLARALERRVSLFMGHLMVFETKDFIPRAQKPWANAYLVPESFESLLLQLPSLRLFGGQPIFSGEDLSAIRSPEVSLETLREGGLRLYDRLKLMTVHFDFPDYLQKMSDAENLKLGTEKPNIRLEIAFLTEQLTAILRSHRLVVFGIRDRDRTEFFSHIEGFVRRLQALQDSPPASETLRGYAEMLGDAIDFIQRYRQIAGLPPHWLRQNPRLMHLYRRLYGVRKTLGAFTLLGPLPQRLRTSSLVFASLLVPNFNPQQLAKVPPSERAYLVIDGPRTTHRYHGQIAARDFFLQGFPLLQKAFSDLRPPDQLKLAEEFFLNAHLLRMYLFNHEKKLFAVILNAESPQMGAARQTPQGTLGEIAKRILTTLGIPPTQVIEATSNDEMGPNHKKLDLEAFRQKIIDQIKA